MSLGTTVISFIFPAALAPHVRHWKPFPVPSDFVAFPHFSHTGFARLTFGWTETTSIFSMLMIAGCLDVARRTPPNRRTLSPRINLRAILRRSPAGSYTAEGTNDPA